MDKPYLKGSRHTGTKTANGIEEHIQSMDNSSLEVWNKVLLNTLNISPVSDTLKLLEQRIILENMEGAHIIELISAAYDTELMAVTGRQHKYGRNPGTSIEANRFVRQFPALVADTIAEIAEASLEGTNADARVDRALYATKATLEELLAGRIVQPLTPTNIRDIRETSGAIAQAENREYYGCSGASAAVVLGTARQQVHEASYSMKGGMELVDIGSCPVCNKECIKGIKDPKTKKFVSCTNERCAAFNTKIYEKVYGKKISILEN